MHVITLEMACTVEMPSNFTEIYRQLKENCSIPKNLDDEVCSSTKDGRVQLSVESVLLLNKILSETDKNFHIHELLLQCRVLLPFPKTPPRNPELEDRIQRLKHEQANKEYAQMTANVANVMTKKDNVIAEVRSMRVQMIAVVNFILAVVGSFAFVYKAVEYSLPAPDVLLQLVASIIVASIVAIAELYFLVDVL